MSFSEMVAAGPLLQVTFTRFAARSAATKLSPSTSTQPGTVPDASSSIRLRTYPGTRRAAESSIDTTFESYRVGGIFGRA